MVLANDIKKGMVIKIEDKFYNVVEFQLVQPGKGGAFVRTKLKNIAENFTIERTFKSNEKLENVYLNARKMQFLYKESDYYTFMDTENFEQVHLTDAQIGDFKNYLKEGTVVEIEFHETIPININLPNFVFLKVTKTEPGVKGDTVSAAMKPAIVETGAKIMVPLFINVGDTIKIDVRDNTYCERV